MKTTPKLDQRGMVSILVTLIMMIVITLIVIGFGEVARHNQREALDRQLATQAFYAAETGVNDVTHLIGLLAEPANYNLTDTTNYDSCAAGDMATNFMNKFHLAGDLVAGDDSVAYTCLLVTPNVPNIKENIDNLGDSVAVPVKPSAASDLTFNWVTNDDSNNARAPGDCPTNGRANNFIVSNTDAGWQKKCEYGILRLDLFDETLNGASTDADHMADSTASFYFVPAMTAGAIGPVNYGGATVIKASCDDTSCTATIPKAVIGNRKFFDARLSAIYEPLNTVTISGNTNVTFSGAQLLIDATGRARDQLKRIQVRIKLSGDTTASVPGNAVQSGDALCKRFLIFNQPSSRAGDGNDSDIPSELCSSGN